MSTADDLIAFLSARLDEDEAAARAAPGNRWRSFTEDDIAGASVYDEQWVLLYPMRYDHDDPLSAEPGATGPQYIQRARGELGIHIARHDPARVLRDVEAKRQIIEVYEAAAASNDPAIDYSIGLATMRMVLRSYATACNDHPDYREEWVPVPANLGSAEG